MLKEIINSAFFFLVQTQSIFIFQKLENKQKEENKKHPSSNYVEWNVRNSTSDTLLYIYSSQTFLGVWTLTYFCKQELDYSRPGAEARRSNPTPEARGSSLEDQSHLQGAVAVWAQEGLEELSHVEGQEGWRWGDTPRPR